MDDKLYLSIYYVNYSRWENAMLIRFHVSNFLSFNEGVELSMIPGKARKHQNHIVRSKNKAGISVLRAAITYGANASGKSNLVKAMSFAKELILKGTEAKESIPRTHFKLSAETPNKPSEFEIEIIYEGQGYVYGFKLDKHRIHEEWLYEILKTTEKMLFERKTSSSGKTTVEFDNLKLESNKEKDFLDFVAMGTRPNQLFLTESIERDVKHFEMIDKWFRNNLEISFPSTRWPLLVSVGKDQDLGSDLVEYLERLGTGISGFKLTDVDPEQEFSSEFIDELLKIPSEEELLIVGGGPEDKRYLLEIDNGEIKANKLMLRHQMSDSDKEILFDMSEESDGTRRLMDLFPGIANLESKEKVFVVDELDRSLHPVLSRELIKLFLQNGTNSSQLIATTHESNLLDLNLLRRDEIWFIEKDRDGASQVYSLEEYAPRHDKDIEKGYMRGRYGAIPIIGDISFKKEGV